MFWFDRDAFLPNHRSTETIRLWIAAKNLRDYLTSNKRLSAAAGNQMSTCPRR